MLKNFMTKIKENKFKIKLLIMFKKDIRLANI